MTLTFRDREEEIENCEHNGNLLMDGKKFGEINIQIFNFLL